MRRPEKESPYKLPSHRSSNTVWLLVDKEWHKEFNKKAKSKIKNLHPTRGLIEEQGLNGPILKSGLKIGSDCDVVSEAMWRDIEAAYPDSQPIPRYLKHPGDQIQTDTIVLPAMLLTNDLIRSFEKGKADHQVPMRNNLWINPLDTVADLQQDIRTLLLSKRKYAGREIAVRLWVPTKDRIHDRNGFETYLQQFLSQPQECIQIRIEGTLLDPAKTIEDADLEQAALVCVEAVIGGVQLCYNEENPIITQCSGCQKIKPLTTKCLGCQFDQVKYCSEECIRHDYACVQSKKKHNQNPFQNCTSVTQVIRPIMRTLPRRFSRLSISKPTTPLPSALSTNHSVVHPGLINLGNYCYLNAALQCLMRVTELTDYIKGSAETAKDPLIRHYRELLENISKQQSTGYAGAVQTSTFKRQVGAANMLFRNNNQHDSQEFLSFLIDHINDHTQKPPSIISQLFEGTYRSTLECQTCHHTSAVSQSFFIMNLPLPKQVFCIVKGHNGTAEIAAECWLISEELKNQLEEIAENDMGLYFPHGLLIWNKSKLIDPLDCDLTNNQQIELRARTVKQIAADEILRLRITQDHSKISDMMFGYSKKEDTLKDLRENIQIWAASTVFKATQGTGVPEISVIRVGYQYQNNFACALCREKCQGCPLPSTNLLVSSFLEEVAESWKLRRVELNVPRYATSSLVIQMEIAGGSGISSSSAKLTDVRHSSKVIPLKRCFQNFFEPESLTEANGVHCDRCQMRTNMTKTMSVACLPKYLTIHFKRFQKKLTQKICTEVSFPVAVTDFSILLPFEPPTNDGVQPSANYELLSICNHIGSTLSLGHYTAICKIDGEWLLFNDETVMPVSQADLQPSDQAYYLIYQRK